MGIAVAFLVGVFVFARHHDVQTTKSSDGTKGGAAAEKVLYTCANGIVNTLDPALAADLTSSYMVAALYDTLIEYDYTKRPYQISPSMIEKLPDVGEGAKDYIFVLRDDLYFIDDPCFAPFAADASTICRRKVTSRDVVFSLLRLADVRLRSPGNWMWRGKIKGIEKFYERTSQASSKDFSPYDSGCEGFEIIDDRTFKIKLEQPDPRFLYLLAIPYASIVSRTAVEHYGETIAERPVGSGAFTLREWNRDYVLVMDKNPNYRCQFYRHAENKAEQAKGLPLLDRVVCYLVKQPLSTWLMFLQGELDMSSLDKESFDAVVDKDMNLVPSLGMRGIKMVQIPSFEVVYVGFNHNDQLFRGNVELRRALSLAYDVKARIRHVNNLILPANGPIPPGAAGYDEKYKNPYGHQDLEKAAAHLALAGYPNGFDPMTGKPLEITFDLGYTDPHYRQLAELMVNDMRKIGVKIKPILNNKPRFFQKLREGQVQMFHMSWVGDYPDAENFLQLFYGANAGTCNRANFKDEEYDKLFESIKSMPDCHERTAIYAKMAKNLTEKCPWIFEGYPISYKLTHCWLENYLPHDFAFNRWKYLSVDPAKRAATKNGFIPINMGELRK